VSRAEESFASVSKIREKPNSALSWRNLYEKRRHSLHRKRMVTDAAQTAPEVATGAA
jgi:hypothetical protein